MQAISAPEQHDNEYEDPMPAVHDNSCFLATAGAQDTNTAMPDPGSHCKHRAVQATPTQRSKALQVDLATGETCSY